MSSNDSKRGKIITTGCTGMVLITIGSLLLLYWGYCWGWWGRNNLILQSWFQCNCPVASEEARYQPFRIVVSACSSPLLYDISPSGHYALIGEYRPRSILYRLDFETGHKVDVAPLGGIDRFLSDALILMKSGNRAFILDLNDRTQTVFPVVELGFNQTLQQSILGLLRNAEQVIVLDGPVQAIVALAYEYKQHPAQNVFIDVGDDKRAIQLLANEKIVYSRIPRPYKIGKDPDARYSQNGQFWADYQGIHLAQTQQTIVSTGQTPANLPYDAFGPQGWVKNDQAVVYGSGGVRYLTRSGGFWPSYFPVPQPILLLEVPQQYRVTPAP